MSSAKTEAAASQALTPELKAFIAEWKSKPGNLIMVLHHVQEHFGYIPRKVRSKSPTCSACRWRASTA